ncbi:hypothetical protein RB195_003935 [Necator americanus]|uniref:Uncharacterized protein n=1 Tax=Necator americanus TaxID=51031 RepID=A0ABR1DQY9_NECAM
MDADESLARAMEDGGKDDEIGDEINSQRLRRRSRRRDSTQCDDHDVRTDGGGGAGDGCPVHPPTTFCRVCGR